MRITGLILMFAATSVTAETEIHRCLLGDGSVAFQEMPCAEPVATADDASKAVDNDSASPAPEDDVFDFVNPFDEPASPAPAFEPARPLPASQDRAECEKTTRDAIDTIDLEMRQNAYTQEQGREYLAQLLALTRQLRTCKQL